jgi:hypothetical protein
MAPATSISGGGLTHAVMPLRFILPHPSRYRRGADFDFQIAGIQADRPSIDAIF